MDLKSLGVQMSERKQQLMNGAANARTPRRSERHSYLNA
jgi:hypothetical protein